jgi:basic amino acid/polyamine antiporter, APA family
MTLPSRRLLTTATSAALVVSNMIGTGIFATTGFLAADLGKPLLVVGIWGVGGIVALTGCAAYAELGLNIPKAGGEYAYLRASWGPGWGFLSGWVSFFVGFSAPLAATAIAFSEYLGHYLPALSGSSSPNAHFHWLHYGAPEWISVSVILCFALINMLGLKLAAKVQYWLTAVKLGAIVLFVVAAFALGHGNWDHFHVTTARESAHGLVTQFAVSLVVVMFAYSGWNAANYVAEEIKDPTRTLPLALFLGTGAVALLYLALNIVFVYALPLGSMKGVVAIGALASDTLFGRHVGGISGAVMAGMLLASISAMSLVGPRVYYAMARDGCFPGGAGGAAELHGRWGTPAKAIWYQTIASAIMVLTGTFEALVYYIGFSLILFAALAAAGLLRIRRRPQFRRLRITDWCYPAIPLTFIAVSAWMLVWTFVVHPGESGLGLTTILAGAIFYRLCLREPQKDREAPL